MTSESLALRPELPSNSQLSLSSAIQLSPITPLFPSKLAIDDFNASHTDQIMALLCELKDHGSGKDMFLSWEIFQEKLAGIMDYSIKVIEENSTVLGFITYSKAMLSEDFYELHWMAVKPSCRSRGFGRKLIEEMEQHVRSNGGKAIILDTFSSSNYDAARHLYEKLGYKLFAKLENYYSKGIHQLIYKKDLDSK